MATDGDLRADGLGVTVVEQCPGHGRRSREPASSVAPHLVAREHVFGKDPAETGLIDFADERPHGAVMARPAVAVQAGTKSHQVLCSCSRAVGWPLLRHPPDTAKGWPLAWPWGILMMPAAVAGLPAADPRRRLPRPIMARPRSPRSPFRDPRAAGRQLGPAPAA